MIISALKITPEYPLKLDEAQMVLDWESLMVALGLKYWLQCVNCYPRYDPNGDAVEAQITKHGPALRLELACACSRFVYRGDDLKPTEPKPMDITARVDQDVQETRALGRPEMFTFDAFDQLRSHTLKMRYWMRCMRCEHENQNDGIHGAGQSTASRFVVECHCTKRVYEGHDAPVAIQ